MLFEKYSEDDYEAVCDFLIELNRADRSHINWNWARFEWMYEHPEFDKGSISSIGLWRDDEKVVGAAIYDMYFGEGFCGVLPGYESIYPKTLKYACCALKDEGGFSLAVCDDNPDEIKELQKQGFLAIDQSESIMELDMSGEFMAKLPEGLSYYSPDPVKDTYKLEWLFWQGFDHGEDKKQFEQQEQIIPRVRKHYLRELGVAAVSGEGELVSFCGGWYSEKTDYVYIEPVCTIPAWRGKGVASAVIHTMLSRARYMGANKAYVISDMDFYAKLGFVKKYHYTFYKKDNTD